MAITWALPSNSAEEREKVLSRTDSKIKDPVWMIGRSGAKLKLPKKVGILRAISPPDLIVSIF